MAIIPIRTGPNGDYALTFDDIALTYQLDVVSTEVGIESFTFSGAFGASLNAVLQNSPHPILFRAVSTFVAFEGKGL